jgi:Domain of unknown function (DUF5668)
MTDPTDPNQSTSTARGGSPPPPPPSGAQTPPGWGPDWGWRHRDRRRDSGGLFFGVLLVLVGGYFLLRDTLHVQLPNLGELWPVLVIALGLWIVLSAARRGDRL